MSSDILRFYGCPNPKTRPDIRQISARCPPDVGRISVRCCRLSVLSVCLSYFSSLRFSYHPLIPFDCIISLLQTHHVRLLISETSKTDGFFSFYVGLMIQRIQRITFDCIQQPYNVYVRASVPKTSKTLVTYIFSMLFSYDPPIPFDCIQHSYKPLCRSVSFKNMKVHLSVLKKA